MSITPTSSKVTDKQGVEIENFLSEFLPRLKRQPGELGIYHSRWPANGDEVTTIIWENEQAMNAYRGSILSQKPIAFEISHN
jgi:heme-degrading monooxygenase HmoA